MMAALVSVGAVGVSQSRRVRLLERSLLHRCPFSSSEWAAAVSAASMPVHTDAAEGPLFAPRTWRGPVLRTFFVVASRKANGS